MMKDTIEGPSGIAESKDLMGPNTYNTWKGVEEWEWLKQQVEWKEVEAHIAARAEVWRTCALGAPTKAAKEMTERFATQEEREIRLAATKIFNEKVEKAKQGNKRITFTELCRLKKIYGVREDEGYPELVYKMWQHISVGGTPAVTKLHSSIDEDIVKYRAMVQEYFSLEAMTENKVTKLDIWRVANQARTVDGALATLRNLVNSISKEP